MIGRLRGAIGARVAAGSCAVLARRARTIRCAPPVASFTFDDVPLSAYTSGAALLERHGARGTYFVAGGCVGTAGGDEPLLGPGEIRDLLARGHEIGCHTHDHVRPRGRGPEEIESDLGRNARALDALLPGVVLESFAYPFGEVTVGLKRAAGARFASCRTIRPGVNAGGVDGARLRANALYGREPDLDRIDALLAEAIARAGWVIFYTHEVREAPGARGCSPAHLEAVIARTLGAGLEIRPVGEVR